MAGRARPQPRVTGRLRLLVSARAANQRPFQGLFSIPFPTFFCFLWLHCLHGPKHSGKGCLVSQVQEGWDVPLRRKHVSGELRYRSELWGCWRGLSVNESTTRMKLAVFVQKHTPNKLTY